MKKMRMESVDMTAQNVDKIGMLFPNCITETLGEDGKLRKAINFDMLRQMLSGDVVDGDEAYEFTWVGKKAAIVEANKPIRKTLRPCPEESKDWDTTENLYIEGDNLEVLKMLQESYLRKIDLIFIDPPYNTGSDFIYQDNFEFSEEEYDQLSGNVDGGGNRLVKNTDSNGRFHSDWCSMIYSRLLMARNLLSDTGSIFIAIDDHEYANLKAICDELFGAHNYIATVIWENFYGRSNAAAISPAHNYILIYSNAGEAWKYVRNLLPRSEESESKYKNPDNDPRGPWRLGPIFASGERHEGLMYTITTPTGKKISPPKGSHWRMVEKDFWDMVKDGRILFGMDGEGAPATKLFLSDVQGGMVPRSIWLHNEVGHSQEAKRELQALFPDNIPFDTPKPTRLLKQIITIGASANATILDFFSGSSSTADAVMQLNATDGTKRKFIMVQIPEEVDNKGYFSDSAKSNTICEIGKERIRRAGEKLKASSPLTTQDLDVGFRVLKADDTNMNAVYYSIDEYSQDLLSSMESNIKADRTELDLLFGCLLDWGLSLSEKFAMFQIDGINVYAYGMTAEEYHDYKNHMITYQDGIQVIDCQPEKLNAPLIACFAENVPEAVIKRIAKMQPLRVVFRDSCFADSPSKINVYEIFKMLAPDTRVRVI